MKIKILLVLAVIALGCCSFANAQSYNFGFLNYTGGLQYCNYESFTVYGGFYLTGSDNLANCGLGTNGTIVGWKSTIPATAGFPLSGAGYAYADNQNDVFCGCDSGQSIETFTKTKASSKKYGWILLVSSGGVLSFDNYGFLTNTLADARTTKGNGTTGYAKKR